MNDLREYTDAELSMFVFNTAEYYIAMIDLGLDVVASKLRISEVLYTTDQWDMLERDYFEDKREREQLA